MTENRDLNERFDQLEKRLDGIAMANPWANFNSQDSRSDEIDLRELWNILWQGKWWIIGITFLFGVAGFFYTLRLPDIYKSEGIYSPAQQEGVGGIASQFGGLAAMAGINVGSGGDNTEKVIALLNSYSFLVHFVKENDLQSKLLAVDGWELEAGFHWDHSLYDSSSGVWMEEYNNKYSPAERNYKAAEVLKSCLNISYDKKKGLVRVSLSWFEPAYAKYWLEHLIVRANSWFMRMDVASAEANIEFLNKRLAETPVAEMKKMLFEMMESEMRALMLANAGGEYVFKEVVAPGEEVFPIASVSKVIILLMAFLGGAVGSVGIFLISKRRKL